MERHRSLRSRSHQVLWEKRNANYARVIRRSKRPERGPTRATYRLRLGKTIRQYPLLAPDGARQGKSPKELEVEEEGV